MKPDEDPEPPEPKTPADSDDPTMDASPFDRPDIEDVMAGEGRPPVRLTPLPPDRG